MSNTLIELLEQKGEKLSALSEGRVTADAYDGFGSNTIQKELIRDNVLPDRGELPASIQEQIVDFSSVEDIRERLEIVNNFVNTSINLKEVKSGEFDRSHQDSWVQTLRKGEGDCDDFAYVKAAILSYTGIDPEKINLVGGKMQQVYAGGTQTTPENHAIVIVEDKGAFYILDNLVSNVGEIDVQAEGFKTGNTLQTEFFEEHGAASTVFSDVYFVGNLSTSQDDQKIYIQESGPASCTRSIESQDQPYIPGQPPQVICNF